jgi:hypothetical protein
MATGAPGAGNYTADVPLRATVSRDTLSVNANSFIVLRTFAGGFSMLDGQCK